MLLQTLRLLCSRFSSTLFSSLLFIAFFSYVFFLNCCWSGLLLWLHISAYYWCDFSHYRLSVLTVSYISSPLTHFVFFSRFVFFLCIGILRLFLHLKNCFMASLHCWHDALYGAECFQSTIFFARYLSCLLFLTLHLALFRKQTKIDNNEQKNLNRNKTARAHISATWKTSEEGKWAKKTDTESRVKQRIYVVERHVSPKLGIHESNKERGEGESKGEPEKRT